MEVVIAKSSKEIGKQAADLVVAQVSQKPYSVLGLATGASPLFLYSQLIDRYRRNAVSFAHTTMFLVDEYVGLPRGHVQSYRAFIRRVFTDHIDVPSSAVHSPDANAADWNVACEEYEAAMEHAGGIDLQVLGIGRNGHIGFNEPGSSFASRTHLTALAEKTRCDNAQYFSEKSKVPTHALTQGIGTILAARHIVLMASGAKKSRAIALALEGPMTAMVPASALQLHPHVTVFVDDEAGGELQHFGCHKDVALKIDAFDNAG